MEPEQNGYAAIKKVDELRQEPEKIRRWREDQRVMIEKKGESPVGWRERTSGS